MTGMDSRQLLGDAVHVPGQLLVLELLPDEYFERLGIAQSCAGMSLPVRDGRLGSEHVEPAQFVAWARGKGFALPRELDHLAAGEPISRARAAPPTPKPAAGRAGRKPGSGSIDDKPALARMLMLLAEGRATSVLAAARLVSSEQSSAHSIDAEVRRLRTKFAKRWGTVPPAGKTWRDVTDELLPN